MAFETSEPEIDTTQTREIGASPLKLVLLGLGALAFAILGYVMANVAEGTGRYSVEMLHIVGWASMIFFGLCGLLIFWRLLTQRGPAITLSPQGLRDVRVSADTVPWPAVASLATWQHSGQRVMVVALKPGEEDKLNLTTIARMSRKANAKLGADGLAISAQGTRIGHDDLLAMATAYAQRYGGG